MIPKRNGDETTVADDGTYGDGIDEDASKVVLRNLEVTVRGMEDAGGTAAGEKAPNLGGDRLDTELSQRTPIVSPSYLHRRHCKLARFPRSLSRPCAARWLSAGPES